MDIGNGYIIIDDNRLLISITDVGIIKDDPDAENTEEFSEERIKFIQEEILNNSMEATPIAPETTLLMRPPYFILIDFIKRSNEYGMTVQELEYQYTKNTKLVLEDNEIAPKKGVVERCKKIQ